MMRNQRPVFCSGVHSCLCPGSPYFPPDAAGLQTPCARALPDPGLPSMYVKEPHHLQTSLSVLPERALIFYRTHPGSLQRASFQMPGHSRTRRAVCPKSCGLFHKYRIQSQEEIRPSKETPPSLIPAPTSQEGVLHLQGGWGYRLRLPSSSDPLPDTEHGSYPALNFQPQDTLPDCPDRNISLNPVLFFPSFFPSSFYLTIRACLHKRKAGPAFYFYSDNVSFTPSTSSFAACAASHSPADSFPNTFS